jgi:hypothetical protein
LFFKVFTEGFLMKLKEIVVGGVYHNDRDSIREVVSIVGESGLKDSLVTYRILAARSEQSWSPVDQALISTIGSTTSCALASFAQWAKFKVGDNDLARLLSERAVKKLRLPPGEKAFMESVARKFSVVRDAGTLVAGISVPLTPNGLLTARGAVRGVEKKKLIVLKDVGSSNVPVCDDFLLTELGVAWIRACLSGTSK